MHRYRMEVSRFNSYDIIVEPGLFARVSALLLDASPESKRAVVVTDHCVRALYAETLAKGLGDAGLRCDVLDVPSGEPSKAASTVFELWGQLVALGFQRRDLIVALGGGVITDLAGFVASTYMRGVPYANVPTTLLAQLDAAIGGKVAVNHEQAKNLIGAFYHPLVVCIDPNVLRTLSSKQLRQGLAEAIKVAIIASPQLFDFIERHAESLLAGRLDALADVVVMAVAAKVKLVSQDPYEVELQRALNFGHAFGHAIESLSSYRGIAHGDAVAIGLAAATRIARSRGVCDVQTAGRILVLLKRLGLPVSVSEFSPTQVYESLSVIRAIRGGRVRLVLPSSIGSCKFTDDLSVADLECGLTEE